MGTVRTSYAKVRIDPVLMKIDIGDKTHATRTGNITFDGSTVDAMPFGVAVLCKLPPDVPLAISTVEPAAAGNIDLSGTGFVLADRFCVHNTQNGFAVTSSDNGRIDFAAKLPASSQCSWVAPDPCPVDPWRPETGGGLLDVEYRP
jgi:hypothetical protein